MSKKPILVMFSDLHLGEYTKFNTDNKRTLSHFKVLSYIKKCCLKYNIPAIFAGDLFHRPEVMSNSFYETLVNEFNALEDEQFKIYAISGNHDCSMSNTATKSSPSWVNSLSKQYKFLECIDNKTVTIRTSNTSFIKVSGIPYLDHNIGLNEMVKAIEVNNRQPHILILHTDYPGAKDTDDSEVDTVENLNLNLLSKFNLVAIGHIHKPQRMSKKVYMIGAPLQQRRTDKNCDLGYWILYSDMSMKFKSLARKFPKFVDITCEDDRKDDGNYYTLIMDKQVTEKDENESNTITYDLSRSKLVREYFKIRGIDDKPKRKALIKILKQTE